jgi:hypothetical protein
LFWLIAKFLEILFNFKKGVRALFFNYRIALLIADISLHRFFFLVVGAMLIDSVGQAAAGTVSYAVMD